MAERAPARLILASGSPARRDLLARAGIPFEVMPASIGEPTGEGFNDPRQERSIVHFTKLTDAQLDAYLATRQWQGCSGAYAIQEHDDPYVQLREGSLSNVIGLPMESLRLRLALIGAIER